MSPIMAGMGLFGAPICDGCNHPISGRVKKYGVISLCNICFTEFQRNPACMNLDVSPIMSGAMMEIPIQHTALQIVDIVRIAGGDSPTMIPAWGVAHVDGLVANVSDVVTRNLPKKSRSKRVHREGTTRRFR